MEDDGGVDGDEVGAGHLLVELEEDAETETVEEFLGSHCEHVFHGGFLDRGFLKRVLYSFDFGGDDGVVEGDVF